MGKFPVISISLKGVAGLDFNRAQSALTDMVCAESRRHSYLMKRNALDPYDKQKIEKILKEDDSDSIIDQGLLALSQALQKHHNQKVIILIDEYDVPLAKAYEYGYYDKMVILIRNLFHQALKTSEMWFNDYVETDADRYQKFSQAFINGNAQQIQNMFNAYLMETISIRDTSVRKSMKENFYHGILLGILKYRRD